MVQLMSSCNFQSESDTSCWNKLPVKVEIEDSLDEEHSSLNKRSKLSSPFQQQWSNETSSFSLPPSQYNPLDEPSPLGLRLKKSPSLLDLIQMRLCQGNSSTLEAAAHGENLELGKKGLKGTTVMSTNDKLKASNFPASLLRIGTWECVSRYEGDLVAKCYFAKHKLVWEVLDGGLKSKIEIQWSDIVALKANCPDNGSGTLELVLARQPLFFRETNPQPRKHTLWQATSDFTGGQASMHRRHFLQCPQGLLSKHFEKLIQCDPRLNFLSQQPETALESPYFEPRNSVFEDPDESQCEGYDQLNYVTTFSGSQDAPSPSAAQSSSIKSELQDTVGRAPDHLYRETPSPSSGIDTHAIEENGSIEAVESKGLSHWDQLKVPGLNTSMSMSDLMSHIGNCISEQMTSDNPLFSGEGLWNKDMLEEMTQHLLSDSQFASSASDEKSLMTRVNSLCCLLQKDPAMVGGLDRPVDSKDGQLKSTPESIHENMVSGDFPAPKVEFNDAPETTHENKVSGDFPAPKTEFDNAPGFKSVPSMSRKDSVGDLLLHLPRIASLPQFLLNISEDGDNQAR